MYISIQSQYSFNNFCWRVSYLYKVHYIVHRKGKLLFLILLFVSNIGASKRQNVVCKQQRWNSIAFIFNRFSIDITLLHEFCRIFLLHLWRHVSSWIYKEYSFTFSSIMKFFSFKTMNSNANKWFVLAQHNEGYYCIDNEDGYFCLEKYCSIF